MATFKGEYDLRDAVMIDNDKHLLAHITAVQFRSTREPLYGVSYCHNGEAKEVWIEEWRLTRE